jgi:hypothetical protein
MKRLLFVAVFAMASLSAKGDWFDFYAITRNDPTGQAQFTGESQFFMNVTFLAAGQISLVFTNTGPGEAVVANIYFDYFPELNLELVAINNGEGVKFQASPVNPENLPAGLGLMYPFTSDLGVMAANPKPKNGINPGEGLELLLNHDSSYDIVGLLGSGELRVGLHGISFGEYSESFVNNIPEPATTPLLFIGSVALRWLRIRKDRKNDFIPYMGEHAPTELKWKEHTSKTDRHKARTRCEAAIQKAMG